MAEYVLYIQTRAHNKTLSESYEGRVTRSFSIGKQAVLTMLLHSVMYIEGFWQNARIVGYVNKI